MAIDKGSIYAMNNLGLFYHELNDYNNMLKYYLMAIENNNDRTMDNLGTYYKKQKDYDNMLKYYQMAIERENRSAMYHLGRFYEKKGDFDNMMNYYVMAAERGDNKVLNKLEYEFTSQTCDYLIKYYRKINEMANKIKNLEEQITQLEYEPDGAGYQIIKKHFENLIGSV
jgi:tetratricopeptide (TPR) repeat protein